MLDIKERDPLNNLVLEVLDDPSKKEMVFYLMCYSQLVRREGNPYVELEKFLSCAYRNFRNARNYWKDVLVEMNLFVISDLYGNIYSGKDIYRVEEGGIYLITIRSEYLGIFESISQKALRLWNILSRTMVYRKHLTAQDAVVISTMMFNEGLYEELKSYCEICVERYPRERGYFQLLYRLATLYLGQRSVSIKEIRDALQEAQNLGDVYYGFNIFKLKKDLENLLRRVEVGKSISPLKIEFINQRRKKGSWLRRMFSKFKDMIDKMFRRDKDKYFFEGALCSKSFQTLYTS
ncbi:hypothetical protein IAE16_05365 [Hydrogenobacter sp. T-2]|uniref:hypothetical protein n=1 Tax=Pampinifervens diazotrophicum TaxID=1632018 RepID=UPI002B2640EA|nr:hypothetical protein [Hydrogenobacter sp. T-2]WPM31255.1 hypothetical protein IAE16_05365 [Hydrogenobacter sp. T-2]